MCVNAPRFLKHPAGAPIMMCPADRIGTAKTGLLYDCDYSITLPPQRFIVDPEKILEYCKNESWVTHLVKYTGALGLCLFKHLLKSGNSSEKKRKKCRINIKGPDR